MLFKRVRAALWGLGHPRLGGGVFVSLSLAPFFSTTPRPRSIASFLGVILLFFPLLGSASSAGLCCFGVFVFFMLALSTSSVRHPWLPHGAAAAGALSPFFCAWHPHIQGSTPFCAFVSLFSPLRFEICRKCESSSGVCIKFCVPRERAVSPI